MLQGTFWVSKEIMMIKVIILLTFELEINNYIKRCQAFFGLVIN